MVVSPSAANSLPELSGSHTFDRFVNGVYAALLAADLGDPCRSAFRRCQRARVHSCQRRNCAKSSTPNPLQLGECGARNGVERRGVGAPLGTQKKAVARTAFVEDVLAAIPVIAYDVAVAEAHARRSRVRVTSRSSRPSPPANEWAPSEAGGVAEPSHGVRVPRVVTSTASAPEYWAGRRRCNRTRQCPCADYDGGARLRRRVHDGQPA